MRKSVKHASVRCWKLLEPETWKRPKSGWPAGLCAANSIRDYILLLEEKRKQGETEFMNNEIFTFTNEEFNVHMRTVQVDGEVWFVAKDIAEVLGYSNTRDAIAKHVDEEDKDSVAIYDGKGNPNMTIINESGMYSLVLSSKLPTAKKFKRWVTAEVLPELRKNGFYQLQKQPSLPTDYLSALKALVTAEEARQFLEIENETLVGIVEEQETVIEEQEAILEEQEPLVELANKLMENPDIWHSFKSAAALLNNGYGQNKLFEVARNHKDLISEGSKKNHPYQNVVDKGYYKLRANGGHYNHNNEYISSYQTLRPEEAGCLIMTSTDYREKNIKKFMAKPSSLEQIKADAKKIIEESNVEERRGLLDALLHLSDDLCSDSIVLRENAQYTIDFVKEVLSKEEADFVLAIYAESKKLAEHSYSLGMLRKDGKQLLTGALLKLKEREEEFDYE
ncbi:unnamed protein product [Cylicocyclus nassatus]|uniref:Bro-N domain-containing protein n=1 Tax=Cylicocyclus nassatus TaxID=53992 RepID=A0AA36GQS2_CYLNA|nr:unnamed protein product [Cylicocyclus nassatus]